MGILTGLALVAGMVRGYSGFGFAMLLALGLMTAWPATMAVPVALLLSSLPAGVMQPLVEACRCCCARPRRRSIRRVDGVWRYRPAPCPSWR